MPYTPDTWANNDPTKPLNAARLTKLAGQYPQVMEDLPAKIADSGDPIGAALNGTYVSVRNFDGSPVTGPKFVVLTLTADGENVSDIAVYDSLEEVG